MLSIAAMGGGSGRYYAELARADYYSEGGEPLGRWAGRGAEELSLSGLIDREQFLQVFRGFGPDSLPLVQNAGQETRHPGWDLTFSAPKGVSVLWSVADAETRTAIEDLHREAVGKAISYLEDVAAVTKRGQGGASTEAVRGLLVATFQHGTSRAQDAQLHTHALVLNIAQRDDDTWGTVLGRPLFQHKMVAGALYRAELARGLEGLGVEVERREKDVFDLAQVPKKLIDAHSTRRKEIEAALDERGLAGARAAAQAALATRGPKEHAPRELLLKEWEELAAEHDFSWEVARSIFSHEPASRDQHAQVREAMGRAATRLTTQDSSFTERDFTRRVAEEAPGRGFGVDDIRTGVREHLDTSPEIVRLGRGADGELRYTTLELFELEARMLNTAFDSKGSTAHVVSEKHLERAIQDVEKERGYKLSEEQRAALSHITQATGSIHVVEGMAGTGKTALLDAARRGWEAEGYRVVGAALAGKAARGLQEDAGIQSATIAKRVKDLDTPDRDANDRRPALFRFDSKTVLVVDEAGMVDTPQMARLIEEAKKARSSIVWIGDSRQLQPIETGGGFRALGDLLGRAELVDVQRQRDEWARKAVKHFHAGEAAVALREYALRGFVHVAEDRGGAMHELIRNWSWNGGVTSPKDHLILTSTRAEAHELNRSAQAERNAKGELGEKSLQLGSERIFEGDRVLLTRNSSAYQVQNGNFGTVERINGPKHTLRVRLDDDRTVTLDTREYADVSLGYAATTHKAQGMTVDQAYVLAGGSMQDRALSYVQASRAKLETRFFTDRFEAGDDLAALARQMERPREKELAHKLIEQEQQLDHERRRERAL